MKLSFVLFDEIEKASDALWNLLLGILDKATLTLGDNRRVDFSRAIIFMTSNLGAAEMSALLRPGARLHAGSLRQERAAAAAATLDDKLAGRVSRSGVEAARRQFPPEFMNRIDRVVVFNSLGDAELERILDIELRAVEERLNQCRRRPTSGPLADRCRQASPPPGRHRRQVRCPPPETCRGAPPRAAHLQPRRHSPGAGRRPHRGRL